nr:MAG TPA: hypothetical protein [Caudoviricetes sp.]DAZ14052.1 MAG TPA: hypothetical protein [Caudoviricetes sp.]
MLIFASYLPSFLQTTAADNSSLRGSCRLPSITIQSNGSAERDHCGSTWPRRQHCYGHIY